MNQQAEIYSLLEERLKLKHEISELKFEIEILKGVLKSYTDGKAPWTEEEVAAILKKYSNKLEKQ